MQRFWGNPNAILPSFSGSIVSRRSSGSVPYFHHVSASGISCPGGAIVDIDGNDTGVAPRPFEAAMYVWNFGDADSAEEFISPTDVSRQRPRCRRRRDGERQRCRSHGQSTDRAFRALHRQSHSILCPPLMPARRSRAFA